MSETSLKRNLVGRVASDKMTKTVTVLIERKVKHAMYGKYIVKSRKYSAHNELGAAAGDLVQIQECRPLSKTKSWIVVSVISKAAV